MWLVIAIIVAVGSYYNAFFMDTYAGEKKSKSAQYFLYFILFSSSLTILNITKDYYGYILIPIAVIMFFVGVYNIIFFLIKKYHVLKNKMLNLKYKKMTLKLEKSKKFRIEKEEQKQLKNRINKAEEAIKENDSCSEKDVFKDKFIAYLLSTALSIATYLLTHYIFGFGVTEASISSITVAGLLALFGFKSPPTSG